VPSTVETEHLGVAAVRKLCQQAGWFFRDQPLPDEGIDAQIEASEGGRPSGKLLGVQIKSGTSYFKQPIAGGWRYRIDPKHLGYWRSYSLPVVLVLYDPSTEKAYWQSVLSQHLTQTAKGAHAIDVPEANELKGSTIPQLLALATQGLPRGAPERLEVLRGRRIELDLGWMEMLEGGARLFLEAEQPLKAGVSGGLRLIAELKNDEGRVERDWPWAFLPSESYSTALQEIFPWANLAIDEARYRTEAYPEFVAVHGRWDEDEWGYVFNCEFDKWFSERFSGAVAAYGVRATDNVALWRLELTLNATGKAALNRERAAIYEEAMWDSEFEEEQSRRRAAGSYAADVIEFGYRQVPALMFLTEDSEGYEEHELIVADRNLWSEKSDDPKLAAAVLSHALATAPTQGLVAAFTSRFGDAVHHTDGLAFSDVQEWLEFVTQ
jgi:hypothetical protein